MNYENILVATENSIATITINRPTNALNRKTIEELHQAFQSLEKNYDTRVIILTGSGEKLCCRCRYI
jgi:enoyl-CoA hydratase